MNLVLNYKKKFMKNVIIIIALLLCWYACSDDNTDIPQISGITRTTFVDERDTTTYQCIVVNGQTWMAENLRYRLPLGASEGCYTFNEIPASTSSEDFVAEVSAALESGELVDPNPFPPSNSMSMALNSVLYGMITIAEFKENYAAYPDVAATLDVLEERALVKAIASVFSEAEVDNGGYSEQYGFLYTYEAALRALPEGWRLPTDEDWKALEKALGMSGGEADKEEAWRGDMEGLLLKEGENGVGFNAKMGGALLYGSWGNASTFQNRGSYAYFWTNTTETMNDSIQVTYIRKLNYLENRVFRGTSSLNATAYSVRAIKE